MDKSANFTVYNKGTTTLRVYDEKKTLLSDIEKDKTIVLQEKPFYVQPVNEEGFYIWLDFEGSNLVHFSGKYHLILKEGDKYLIDTCVKINHLKVENRSLKTIILIKEKTAMAVLPRASVNAKNIINIRDEQNNNLLFQTSTCLYMTNIENSLRLTLIENKDISKKSLVIRDA